ncbi:uncharacterized protein N7511_003415 [Penicillium nucicola]|uniref:uncharacterized protein n=1 Tax=Penicillium nucicola TaxID=1850975 RepID=UPI0025458DC2|nr:uncharacterized protein N7511_003415 [Penicillium nucicola]KAJ5771364.1 hypothetical protein N7511_003415 [Penicillium nucicola]
MDVSACMCPTSFPSPASALTCFPKGPLTPQPCPRTCNPAPPSSPVTPRAQLNTCYSGCVDENDNCNGCYVWFHSLCGCIHDFQSPHGTTCISSASPPNPPITPGQPWNPVWMVLSLGDLITTTELIPGILSLGSAVDPDGGFRLGQDTLRNTFPGQKYNRLTGTLAMNSVATRSEEQVHIHLCFSQFSGVRGILDGLTRTNYFNLAWVDLSNIHKPDAPYMYCRASSNQGQDINVSRAISDYLDYLTAQFGPDNCAQYTVGAGVITDSQDYSWACVTVGSRAAETIFCYD